MTGAPEEDFRRLNAEATGNLARAAQRAGVKRFIFISSLRAQADVSANHVLKEDSPPMPTDAYGRSKLAAEQELSRCEINWVALRLALVFGPGVKGNMARLIRLARSPLPLPFGELRARRSLLSLVSLLEAVRLLAMWSQTIRGPIVVADPDALSLPQMITAMRRGLGRAPALLNVSPSILEASFRLAGRSELFRRVAEPLIADPTKLMQMGWIPPINTSDALAQLMHESFTTA
jgi:nucleoside-diphosphate-sugar epimerase